jgi:modulator of FtsH protease HflK
MSAFASFEMPDGIAVRTRLWLVTLRWIAGLAALATVGFTSFYTVNTESVAVVQRFGRHIETTDSGLHFKLPLFIDRVTIVPVRRQLKLEFGFTTRGATNEFQSSEEPAKERDMVTGDLNAAEVEWVVQYGISDPVEYLFQVRESPATLRDVSESMMCEVIGDRTVDEVLTYGRAGIEADCLKKLQEATAVFRMGIRVEQVQLKNIHPPRPVQDSFDEVNRAQQEREERINIANGQYNKEVPRARGLADQQVSAAEGYALRRVNEAEGDVARFRELLLQYEKAPAITRRRLYLETMNEVLPALGGKVVIDEDARQFLPLMNLANPAVVNPPAVTSPATRR